MASARPGHAGCYSRVEDAGPFRPHVGLSSTTAAAGSVVVAAKGPDGLILAPPDAKRFGLPTVSVVAGAVVLTVGPDGSITSLSLRGHVLVNVCAAPS